LVDIFRKPLNNQGFIYHVATFIYDFVVINNFQLL